MTQAKAGASAVGGGASGSQNAPAPPAEGGSTGPGAPKASWGPKPSGCPPAEGGGSQPPARPPAPSLPEFD
eukprot:13054585-Alexandrium_andersonii.AAC.1